MRLYAVVLGRSTGRTYVYGPFTDKEEADAFALFLTAEVDPAHTITLNSPVDELLGYWQNKEQS
jgi:hypothetical protein